MAETGAAGAPWAGWDRGSPGFRRITMGLFAAGFAVFAQVFATQAMLPAISADMGGGAATSTLALSATTLGLAAAVLPWAWVADRVGRVRAMRISLIAASVIGFTIPLLPTLGTVLAARAALGVALGAVPAISVAYLAEELVAGRVAAAAGIFVAGNTFGGICGRLLAGPLSETAGWRWATLAISVVGAVAALVFIVIAPRPRGFRPEDDRSLPTLARVALQLRDPVMLGLYAQGFLLMGSFGAVYNLLGFHVADAPLSVPPALVGLLFTAYLFGTAASRLSGVAASRFGALPVILTGIALMLTGLVLMAVPVLIVVIGGLVVFTIGCFTAHPVASGQSGIRAQAGRAQATALYQLSWLGGTAVFGWLASVVYDRGGWTSTLLMVAGLCGAAAASAVVGLRVLAARRPALPGDAAPAL